MASDEVGRLLGQFAADVGRVLPLAALWAHGSLAYGDFVPGRSDLDLVALIGAQVTSEQRQDLQRFTAQSAGTRVLLPFAVALALAQFAVWRPVASRLRT